MKRTNPGLRVGPLVLVVVLALTAGRSGWPAEAEAQATGNPDRAGDTAGRLGTVRGDTLFVTLEKVISAALERNEMLAASAAMADAADAEALGAWRGFLPRLQLGEFWVNTDDALASFGMKLQQRIVTPADFDPVTLNNPGTNHLFTTRLAVNQPIFNGLIGLNGKKAANNASRAAAQDHQWARETVTFQAAQAYYGLALAKAFETVLVASVESAEGHVRQAEALLEAEMATAADLLKAQVQLSALRQKLIEARNMVAVAGENIELLTATGTDLALAPATGLKGVAAEVQAGALVDTLDTARVVERSDILANLYRTEAAGNLVGVATGAVLPHINLAAQRDLFSQDIFRDDARSWTLGIYATWDIFSGLENIGNIRKARAERRAAEHHYDFQRRQAQVEVTEAWLAVRAAREKVAVAREAVEAALESLRIVENQYREGLATTVELLDTQAAATRAQGDLAQARHDFRVGMARLVYASGIPRTEWSH